MHSLIQDKHFQNTQERWSFIKTNNSTNILNAEIEKSYDLYEGRNLWTDQELLYLASINASSDTINLIKNIINNLLGMELKQNNIFSYSNFSSDEEKELMAKALSDLSFVYQQELQMPNIDILKLKSALICGIGWVNLYTDPTENKICYEYIDPTNMRYDALDKTEDLSQMEYVARIRTLNVRTIINRWPHINKDNSFANSADANEFFEVIELQYKTDAQTYSGITDHGQHFETFNKKEALNLIKNGEELKVKQNYRITRSLFIPDKNTLLEFGPLYPDIPGQGFSYIPFVWEKTQGENIPRGAAMAMRTPQLTYNKLRAIILSHVASNKVIVSREAFPNQTLEEIKQSLNNPQAILQSYTANPISRIPVNENMAGVSSLLSAAEADVKNAMGITADVLGEATNARSALAIETRSSKSLNTQIYGFHKLEINKKKIAALLMLLIQYSHNDELKLETLDKEDNKAMMVFNTPVTLNNKKTIENNIKYIKLHVIIDPMGGFQSRKEADKELLKAFLANSQAFALAKSKTFLKLLGVADPDKIAKEMANINRESSQQESIPNNNGNNQPLGIE